MRNRTKFTLSTIALALCSSVAIAQEDETGFFAKADTTLAHDDNIYRVTDDLAQSDTYISVAPELKLIGGFGKQRFELSYDGDYSKFSDSDDADFADHNFKAKLNFEHTLRLSTRLEAGYQKEHEEPGYINRIQLDMTEYNKFDQDFLLAGLAYGSEKAIGRFSVNYRKTTRDYTTNNLDFLDFTSDQITGRFTYRLAPNTKVYLETILTEYDYSPGQNFELDNTYKRYRAGFSWDFTGKLTGDINIGYQERNYEQVNIQDIDGLAYDGQITWDINSYTKLISKATRESVDSSLEEAGGFLRSTYSIFLSHELTELLKLTADAGYSNDELVFSSDREDERYSYKVGVEYELYRNITLAGSYTYEERDSTFEIANYTANVLSLSINISLED